MSLVTIRENFPEGTANGNSCYACGTGRRTVNGRKESIVDLNMSIDFEGFLMFCESCVTEWATMLGMTDATASKKLEEDYSDLKTKFERLKVEHSLAEDVITSMTRYKENSNKK